MWESNCDTLSDSVIVRGGVAGGVWWLFDTGNLEKGKLSSDNDMLSRRNAAVARRFPVWRRTIASSIKPRWQHAWPKTKYLQYNRRELS